MKTQKLAENRGNINMQNRERFAFFSRQCLLLVFFFLLSGCLAGVRVPNGRLQQNTDVLRSFRAATILPGYSYYIQGVELSPEVIIGIKDGYQLQSRLWKPVDWNVNKMQTAVFWMEEDDTGFCTTGAGYLLLPGGEQVGVWYSQRERAIIKHPEANVVEVYPFDYIPYSSCQRRQWADDR